MVAEGTVESFDQAAFKANLAAHLEIIAADIQLNVTSASVLVIATIPAESSSAADAMVVKLEELRDDPVQRQSVLGAMNVSSIAPPLQRSTVVQAPVVQAPGAPPEVEQSPSPPPPDEVVSTQADNKAAIAVALFITAFVLVGAGAGVGCRLYCELQKRKVPTTTVARDATVATVDIASLSVTEDQVLPLTETAEFAKGLANLQKSFPHVSVEEIRRALVLTEGHAGKAGHELRSQPVVEEKAPEDDGDAADPSGLKIEVDGTVAGESKDDGSVPGWAAASPGRKSAIFL